MLWIGLRQHDEHADAPPLPSPRNGSSPIATSLAWWIASERSAMLKGEPVDLHGPFEGRRTRSCLGRRGLPRVSRADQVGAAVLFEAMPILGWRVHFTRRQLMMPRTARPTLRSLNGDGVADWLDSEGIEDGVPFLISPDGRYDIDLNAYFLLHPAPENTLAATA
jgi:hypothetical protein